MKFNLTLIDGTQLKSVILSKNNQDYRIGELHNTEEFNEYIKSNGEIRMYFCGRYVQGGISHPRIIKDYEILEDDEHTCTLICDCGEIYNYVPTKCKRCGKTFVDM